MSTCSGQTITTHDDGLCIRNSWKLERQKPRTKW